MSSLVTNNNHWLLIVDGYIRQENKIFELPIPSDINKVVWMFYREITRYFDKYNDKLFKLENESKIIIPIGPISGHLNNYMVFPSPNGFSDGVHKWTVKYARDNGYASTRTIGVTSKIDQQWISNGVGNRLFCDDKDGSYWSGISGYLTKNAIIEIVLDLEKLAVSYYKIRENEDPETKLTPQKIERLKPDTIYYFAFCMDCDQRCCAFECVLPRTK